MYEWDKVKETNVRCRSYGRYKASAPKWFRRGLENYESFRDVFFLDSIMRIASSNIRLTADEYMFARKQRDRETLPKSKWTLPTSADFEEFDQRQRARQHSDDDLDLMRIHSRLLTRFRELQLRARDGDLTLDDHKWMRLHMNEEERPEDFSTPGMHRC